MQDACFSERFGDVYETSTHKTKINNESVRKSYQSTECSQDDSERACGTTKLPHQFMIDNEKMMCQQLIKSE